MGILNNSKYVSQNLNTEAEIYGIICTWITYIFVRVFDKWQCVELGTMFFGQDGIATRSLHTFFYVGCAHVISWKVNDLLNSCILLHFYLY